MHQPQILNRKIHQFRRKSKTIVKLNNSKVIFLKNLDCLTQEMPEFFDLHFFQPIRKKQVRFDY